MDGVLLTYDREFRRKSRTVIVFFVAVALLVLLVGYTIQLFLLAFAAVLVAILLDAAARYLEHYLALPRRAGVALVALLIAAAAVGFGYSLAPQVEEELSKLMQSLPDTIERWQRRIRSIPLVQQLTPQGDEADTGDLVPALTAVLEKAGNYAYALLYGLGSIAFAFLVGVYLALSPRVYLDGAVKRLPRDRRPVARAALDEMGHILRRFLVGQLIAMTSVGLMIGVGLKVVGIPLALSLGILSGLLAFIPYLGPMIAGVVVLIATAATSPENVLWAGVVYLGAQLIESYVLTPLIQSQAVHLPPVAILFGQLLVGWLVGPLGVVVSTPLIMVVLIAFDHFVGEDEEEDAQPAPPEPARRSGELAGAR